MAITIVKQPQQLQPVYNEIIYVVTSTLTSQENFRFVADIKVDNNIIASIEFPVNPDGYGVLDIHKHLQSFVTDNFDPTNEGFVNADKSYVEYDIEFKETFRPKWNYEKIINYPQPIGGVYPDPLVFEGGVGDDPNEYFNVGDTILIVQNPPFEIDTYSGIATITNISYNPTINKYRIFTNKPFTDVLTYNNTGFITLPNLQNITTDPLVTINDKHTFNGVVSFKDFINWDYQNYNATQVIGQGKWLTNIPNKYNIQLNSNIWLNVYATNPTSIGHLRIETLGGIYFLKNISTISENLYQVNVSPEFLLNANLTNSAGGEPTTPFTLVNGQCYSVSIVEDLIDAPTIEPIKLCINETCSRYEDIQLVFLDKLGSFIPFHFTLVNRHTKSINRTFFQKDYGKYAPASNNWEYNLWDRGTTNLDTVVTDTFTINSNWVNQSTSDFLMTLFESPEVYWFKENGDVVAINLQINNVERKQIINDQLLNYTLSFELSNKDKKQLG